MRGREKAKMDVEWVSPQIIWEVPEQLAGQSGWRLAKLTHPDDLKTFGTLMRHCAGSHAHWAELGIFHFVTILDQKDVPHATVFMKDQAWLNTPHPDDAQAGWGNTYTYRSTTYDGSANRYNYGRAMLDGKVLVPLEVSNPGDYSNAGKYDPIVKAWFEQVREAGNA